MLPKQFLLSECANLRNVLQETLRFDYGLEGSEDFYNECDLRLKYITKETEVVDENDPSAHKQIMGLYGRLSNLSKLISRIERSSISEYSWPFVSAFKDITKNICMETRAEEGFEDPRIHVISDGGLSSYMIYGEGRANQNFSNRRILTIVFPRTLKHFVLLHPILGHEIGHALFNIAKHSSVFVDILDKQLFSPSADFKDDASLGKWLFSPSAPEAIQKQIAIFTTEKITEDIFFKRYAQSSSWYEEILCDLTGLLIFGPSFVGAHIHLLSMADLSGLKISRTHPPTALRLHMILQAVEILGWRDVQFDNAVGKAASAFWDSVFKHKQTSAWFNVFSDASLKNTLDAMKAYFDKFEHTSYPVHDKQTIERLAGHIIDLVPPVGTTYSEKGEPVCNPIDFRHILFAGWIASEHDPARLDFALVNRLCEHGIMQQRAIDLKLADTPKAA